ALAAHEIAQAVARGERRTTPTSTDACISGRAAQRPSLSVDRTLDDACVAQTVARSMPSVRDIPETRYTVVDGYAIAYQVLGRGREDLVYLPAYVSNVELQWDVPAYASFLDGLASICRLILLDTRGHGCSDRLSPEEAPTLEDS